jgi:uncharacterized protein
MTHNPAYTPQVPPRSTTSKLLILLGICVTGTFAFYILALILASIITKTPITQVQKTMTNPSGTTHWYILTLVTGISHLGGFWLAGLAYLRYVSKSGFEVLHSRQFRAAWLLPTIFLVIAFIPINELFVQLNQNMQLPQALAGIQKVMKEMEDNATNLTRFLTQFTSPVQFVFAFLVMAVFAGVGEELIFRGLLQNLLYKKINNPHTAIWLTAFLFSAIHLQFYGFLPRLLLGALFGYMYYWSGNLWVPILAHITNNGLIVILSFLYNLGYISMDPETAQTPATATALAVVASIALVYYFYHQRSPNSHAHQL